jgi:hypothetical protein
MNPSGTTINQAKKNFSSPSREETIQGQNICSEDNGCHLLGSLGTPLFVYEILYS